MRRRSSCGIRPSDYSSLLVLLRVALGCFRWCPLHRSVKFLAAKLLQEAGKEWLTDKPGGLGTFKWEKSLNLTQPPATPRRPKMPIWSVFPSESLSLSLSGRKRRRQTRQHESTAEVVDKNPGFNLLCSTGETDTPRIEWRTEIA